ncbi:MAG: hypothetical protein IKA86_04605, partial [Paraprevotella sp.]|nr:hypothetical protein [Paraprevotella sp.]
MSSALRWVGTPPTTDYPVSFGIPFAKGELKSDGGVVLLNENGERVPSDYWPMAYWQDGSVKW